ncbi:MAG: substrate-binding domain-containing protein, partial [Verrucomicrobiota bacterium]
RPMTGQIVERLVALGHSRIVTLVPPLWQHPGEDARPELSIREAYQDHGIKASRFHLARFEEGKAGLWRTLEGLFSVTPPTAIILPGPQVALGLFSFCLHHRIRIPRDLSVACLNDGPGLYFAKPSIARIEFDTEKFSGAIAREISRLFKRDETSRPPAVISSPGRLNPGASLAPPAKPRR